MIKFNLIPTWVYAGAVILALGAAGTGGWKLRDHDYQMHLKADTEAALKASEGARQVEAKNEEIGQEIGREVEEAKTEIRYVTRTIIQKVPEYVTLEADARCIVPVGFVLLHNHAATGSAPVPEASGQSHDAPSGVELSDIADTTVGNYGTYNEVAAQLRGLQEWAVEVEKAWPKQ